MVVAALTRTDAMRTELIEMLADGEVHSGANLAQRLNVSRTAVWKHLQQLEDVELVVEATPGKGYRLTRPLDLLQRQGIEDALSPATAECVESLDVHAVIDSTNEVLRGQTTTAGRTRVVLAEYQTGGRGRRGRRWLSPFAGGLCLSASWSFSEMPAGLPALSLAVAVAVCRALDRLGARGVGLKWPNDIVAEGAKLGGLLVEVQGEADGPVAVIVGIGLNIDSADAVADRLAQEPVQAVRGMRPVGLRSLIGNEPPTRNQVAAALINELVGALSGFERDGFAAFVDEWRARDCMEGRSVTLHAGNDVLHGRAAGIADDGSLLIDHDGSIRAFVSGEVTLRDAEAGT